MSEKNVKLNRRRVFSEEFKKARVTEYERGEYSVKELCKLFSLRHKLVYSWIHKYSSYNKKRSILVEMKDSAHQRLKDYEQRIAELERALGQKQLKIDFLEKMIELAEAEHQLSIKKNSCTPPWHGSGNTASK